MKRSEVDRVPKGFWRCRKQQGGVKCLALNPKRKQLCEKCGKRRPKTSKPKHMVVLDTTTYEAYIVRSGGEEKCCICGRGIVDGGRRLHRDHDHATGTARGLLCMPCNTRLPRGITPQWLRDAADYLERFAMERELPY